MDVHEVDRRRGRNAPGDYTNGVTTISYAA